MKCTDRDLNRESIYYYIKIIIDGQKLLILFVGFTHVVAELMLWYKAVVFVVCDCTLKIPIHNVVLETFKGHIAT